MAHRRTDDPEFDPMVDDVDTEERPPRLLFTEPAEPRDGMMWLDKETRRLYARVDGVWLFTTFQGS